MTRLVIPCQKPPRPNFYLIACPEQSLFPLPCIASSGKGALKAELIDVKSSDESVSSFLQSTIHQQILGDTAESLDNDCDPSPVCNCLPGFCSKDKYFDFASKLVRAFHTCLTERKINTGSLLVLSCSDIPFTCSFFLGVTLKKPLLQTVVFAKIDDDSVSFQLSGSDNVPEVTTTSHLFLDMVSKAQGRISDIEAEHWSYKPFIDVGGMLQVNAEHALDIFTFSTLTKATVQKRVPVPLPFGMKPERRKRTKNEQGGQPRKRVKRKSDSEVSQQQETAVQDSSDPDTGSEADGPGQEDTALFDSDEIEPISEVMLEQSQAAVEVANEIVVADEAKDALTEAVEQQKQRKHPAGTGSSYFSVSLGLGVGGLAPTSRAKCYNCKQAILKGDVRFEWFWNRLRPPGWLHSYCLPTMATKFELGADTISKLKQMSGQAGSSHSDDPIRREAERILNTMST